jgi:hypothetical protein
MIDRFCKIILIASCVYTIQAGVAIGKTRTIWSDSLVGKCFSSIENYMVAAYGSDYRSDENIKTIPFRPSHDGKGGKTELMWALDLTPQINIARTLVRIEPSGRACVSLMRRFPVP